MYKIGHTHTQVRITTHNVRNDTPDNVVSLINLQGYGRDE